MQVLLTPKSYLYVKRNKINKNIFIKNLEIKIPFSNIDARKVLHSTARVHT